MKVDQVPQDNSRTYAGHKRALYAVNNDGKYQKVESNGWEAEEAITLMTIDDLHHVAELARERVVNGVTSVLDYHMYANRYDVAGLAQTTGFFKWQIKRHLKPHIFAKLPDSKLQRYAEAFGLNIEQLKELPDTPPL